MILEVVQSKWSLTWYDPLGPRMCVLELMNGHVLQTLREQLKVPGSRLEGSELLTKIFLRRVKLKAHFHDKEQPSDEPQRDEFESLKPKKSNWTPPDGQFTSVDLFVKKCRVDIQKLNFNKSLKFSNLSKEEWTAHQNLKTRDDIVIKPADKGGAVVVWRTDL